MARLYLGVDGGQSGTIALIADESGRILGRGSGGPCNHVEASEGRAKFFRAIEASLGAACQQAGLDPAHVTFAAAALGFSGGAEDKDVYARELIRSAKYKITHDAEIALSGATAGEPGIIVIAGTGSMAFGRNAEGQSARAGGWGYIFGDEGGGFDLTRLALRAALRQEEGWGPTTLLRSYLLHATGATTVNELLHRFYAGLDRPFIASLSTYVTQAAEHGDPVALEILEKAAAKLAWFAEGVYQNLFRHGECVPVAYIGGVFRSAPLLAGFSSQVAALISCEVVAPRFSSAAGAVLDALRLDGNHSVLSAVPESDK